MTTRAAALSGPDAAAPLPEPDGGLTEAEARDAVRDLVHRADPAILERLAVEQNLRSALVRARRWAEDIP